MAEATPIQIYRPEAAILDAPEAMRITIPKWKRVFDCACVILTAPLWVPLMALIALVIRIVSSGPVFFTQERVGFGGGRFLCFKFRTMKVNAETTTHQDHLSDLIRTNKPMIKIDTKGDPRLIPTARILRATGFDELPQVLNVLRGEMSLVGPRPCIPYEYECYEAWQKRRFESLPGLTGLWQVSGKNKTTFNEMIRLDIHYAQNCSVWFDIKIMFKTVPAIYIQIRELGGRLLR